MPYLDRKAATGICFLLENNTIEKANFDPLLISTRSKHFVPIPEFKWYKMYGAGQTTCTKWSKLGWVTGNCKHSKRRSKESGSV